MKPTKSETTYYVCEIPHAGHVHVYTTTFDAMNAQLDRGRYDTLETQIRENKDDMTEAQIVEAIAGYDNHAAIVETDVVKFARACKRYRGHRDTRVHVAGEIMLAEAISDATGRSHKSVHCIVDELDLTNTFEEVCEQANELCSIDDDNSYQEGV